jgi:SAM-dependent methyltransferase
VKPGSGTRNGMTGQTLSPDLARVVRSLGIYPLARKVLYAIDYGRNYRDNRAVRRANPTVAFPPTHLLWVTSPSTSLRTYLTGSEAARNYLAIARAHLPELQRVLEFGCGNACIIRHIPDLSPAVRAYGSDYDPDLIRWCRANVPNVEFTLNSLEPPLDYPDGFFDFVYSRSVYTHLPADLQARWLAEQLRVTRPGGLILLTVHGDAYRHRVTTDELTDYSERGVVEHSTKDVGGPWFTTFNSPAYMESELLAGLEIVHRDVLPETARGLRQDLWVVRKPG